MFGNEQPTAFDIKFRLAGIPVRVTPWFWIIMLLLGSHLFNDPDFGPLYLLLWVVCGFVSVRLIFTIALTPLKPYFHGVTSLIGAPFWLGRA